jgi:hypothetical protein
VAQDHDRGGHLIFGDDDPAHGGVHAEHVEDAGGDVQGPQPLGFALSGDGRQDVADGTDF